jgi:mannose-6-phosphate isomerase
VRGVLESGAASGTGSDAGAGTGSDAGAGAGSGAVSGTGSDAGAGTGSGMVAGAGAVPAESDFVRKAFELLIGGGAAATSLVELAASALAASPAASPATAGGGLSAPLGTVVELQEQYPGDPGVLISLLLNRVSLVPGQAVYLPAGNIHAYLSGLGLEVMASSDNVLRGGLTGKHVDVPELLATVDFAPTAVPFVPTRTTELGQQVFEPPFAEFTLQRVELAPGAKPVPLVQNGPLLVLAVSGSVLLDSPRGDMVLARGGSVFVPAVENPVLVHPAAQPSADPSGAPSGAPAVIFAVTVAG